MIEMNNEDKELHDIFHGEEKPLHPETIHITLGAEKPARKPVATKESNPGKNTPKEEKPVDAQWEPVKPARDFMDKLKRTAKDTCMYAVLSMILFYWQQTGRLETTTSWHALLLCVGMVFFSIGKNCRGGVK